MGVPLELHEPSLEAIRERFRKLGREMTPNNAKQARFPRGSDGGPEPVRHGAGLPGAAREGGAGGAARGPGGVPGAVGGVRPAPGRGPCRIHPRLPAGEALRGARVARRPGHAPGHGRPGQPRRPLRLPGPLAGDPREVGTRRRRLQPAQRAGPLHRPPKHVPTPSSPRSAPSSATPSSPRGRTSSPPSWSRSSPAGASGSLSPRAAPAASWRSSSPGSRGRRTSSTSAWWPTPTGPRSRSRRRPGGPPRHPWRGLRAGGPGPRRGDPARRRRHLGHRHHRDRRTGRRHAGEAGGDGLRRARRNVRAPRSCTGSGGATGTGSARPPPTRRSTCCAGPRAARLPRRPACRRAR